MRTLLPITTLGLLIISAAVSAQDFPGSPAPAKEHSFLKKFVGVWDVETQSKIGEGQPDMKGTAVMKSRMLGGFWLINESEYDFGAVKVQSLQMIGFDSKKKKYVGSWNDSVSDFMWRYEGTVNKKGTKLTLNATGPDINDPSKMADYQDAFEFIDDNTLKATSSMKVDGKWKVFMEGTVKKRKKK